MAVNKLVDSGQLDSDLSDVADAIRTKGGTSSQLSFPDGFISAIEDIPSGSTGAKFVKGTFTTPTSGNSYTLDFGETFSGNYIVIIEATDDTKTAIMNTDVSYKRTYGFIGKRYPFTIDGLSSDNTWLIDRIIPSTSALDRALSGTPTYADSSVTLGNYAISGQYATNCLFQGCSYNFYVVEIK